MQNKPTISNTFLKTSQRIFRHDPNFSLRCMIESPQTVTAMHRHEFTEVAFVLRGVGEHRCGDNPPRPIHRGDILIIPPGGKHGYTRAEELAVMNLVFDAKRLPLVLLELYNHPGYKSLFAHPHDYYAGVDFPSLSLSEESFRELEFFALKLCDPSRLHCYKLGLFMVLLTLLCEGSKRCSSEEGADSPLNIPRLVRFLSNNYLRDIYLDELTDVAGMSRATLIRNFRAAMGVTPMKYLCNLRLKHAAELLLNTDLNMKEVAAGSNFPSLPYFYRMFRAHYGVSPQVWREQKNRTGTAEQTAS